jgi:hypothetical protein
MRVALLAVSLVCWASAADAQTISFTGFLEGRGFAFAQRAPNDEERRIADGLFRSELVLRPADWLHLAAGVDFREDSHDQVEDEWRFDYDDRGILRPRIALRRAAATIAHRGLTVDLGKQFIRWGRADVIYPTDRFAPRDYLNVIDAELLPVIAARASVQIGSETLEGIWVPQLTPSRLPLLDQRWVSLPPAVAGLTVVDGGSSLPVGNQFGARWRHTGSRLETAVSFFDGFNHLPDIDPRLQIDSGAIELVRVFPTIRMYGADVAVPTSWLTLKAEAAYVTSPPETSDEYFLYVLEIERQVGEWLFDVGYAGEVVQEERVAFSFAPDRSMARSIIGRASYTVDPLRTVNVEGAARQNGDGYYAKLEYSQTLSSHWRMTVTGVAITGDDTDFIGQYHRNSHASLGLRYSF